MYWLFDHTDFVPRSQCGNWGILLPLLNQIANLAITFAYITIPIFLIYIVIKRPNIMPKMHVLVMFALFIILCGFTHLCNYLAFYYPLYRVFTILDILTAFASVGTMVVMPEVITTIFEMPSREEYESSLLAQREATTRAEKLACELKSRAEEQTKHIGELQDQLNRIREGSNPVAIANELLKEIAEIKRRLESR